jgi:hypothetical protein
MTPWHEEHEGAVASGKMTGNHDLDEIVLPLYSFDLNRSTIGTPSHAATKTNLNSNLHKSITAATLNI